MAILFSTVSSIAEVDAFEWDSLWSTGESLAYPFTQHAFFSCLERSNSIDGDSGWLTRHLIAVDTEADSKAIVFAMPLFIKSHSYGEYVFDWSWANAYHQAGLNYYPKLLNAIPFTPSVGPRVAIAAHYDSQERQRIFSQAIEYLQSTLLALKGSSLHLNYPNSDCAQLFKSCHLLQRRAFQYHWFNHNYKDFDDFLSGFASRKRKAIKRERRRVREQGLELELIYAKELSHADWDSFYKLYHHTYLKRSGQLGYLGQNFFHLLGEAFPDQVFLVRAHLASTVVAASLFLQDDDTLYGRYWGSLEDFDGLHFEACYYQGIEHAIQKGLSRFDPGAQGEHKIQRGFIPIQTSSYHYLVHDEFSSAVQRFLQQESHHIETSIAQQRQWLPFKEGASEFSIGDDVLL